MWYKFGVRKLQDKIIPLDKVSNLSQQLRSLGKKIVSTNGCFDILHLGHIEYLDQARNQGDVLVVGVNTDSSVRAIKGKERPIHDEQTRLRQVAGLEAVDYVVLFPEKNPENFLKKLRPDLHVKGGDYIASQLPEKQIVEKMGGKVLCLPQIGSFSTSDIIRQVRSELKWSFPIFC